MGLKQWVKSFVIANGLIKALEAADRQGKVKEIAQEVDKIVDEHLQKRSEHVQEQVCMLVLIPLMSELLVENPGKYSMLLEAELLRVKEKLKERHDAH